MGNRPCFDGVASVGEVDLGFCDNCTTTKNVRLEHFNLAKEVEGLTTAIMTSPEQAGWDFLM